MPISPSDPPYDVAVVGAGPAGLAAASAAASAGRRVTLIDAGASAGGQYWRHPAESGEPNDRDVPHGRTFNRLRSAVRSSVTYRARCQVWTVVPVDEGYTLHTTGPAGDGELRAAAVVLATGAYDRQLPFPGWDLPGVFTAGGAQALLKGHRVVPGRRITVAGTGPFLLPVAAGLATAGANVAGVFEANRPGRWPHELLSRPGSPSLRDKRAGGAFRAGLDLAQYVASRAAEGARYAGTLGRHGVRVHIRHAVVAAHGTDRVRAATVARLDDGWNVVPGSERTVDCDAVAVGWGFTPQVEIAVGLGAATRVDADGSLVVTVGRRQETTVPRVFAAGEICGVGGAELGVVEGEIAGLAAAAGPGRSVSVPGALLRRRSVLLTFVRAMHRVHPVRNGWRTWLRPDTLVCRCEEVPVADVEKACTELGAGDERSVKLLTRTGMGWCQGRMCGFAVGGLIAAPGSAANPHSVAERPLAAPVSLGALAGHPAAPATPPDSAREKADAARDRAGPTRTEAEPAAEKAERTRKDAG